MHYEDYDFENDCHKPSLTEKNIMQELKTSDNGYYCSQKYISGLKKPINFECYGSGDIGSNIRDAITGDRYKHYLVGSDYENLFFKVSICTGEFKGRNRPTLFYNSPEEYENHKKIYLDTKIKEAWRVKKASAEARIFA